MQRVGSRAAALALALAATCAIPAVAQTRRSLSIDTSGQSLATALNDIAKRSGVDLLLAASSADRQPAPRLHGRFTIDEVLPRLLAGSGLTYRRTVDGAYIVVAAPPPGVVVEDIPVTLPELLVVGARTQNSDIRRGENDIQPYKLWSGRDIEQAHSPDINDFLRTRLTGNAQIASPQQRAGAVNSSEVDLRGLGTGQTLVLVDGRRMPSLPLSIVETVGFEQSDLNGVPLSAIERIEVLNSTAGGIYGPGATAGAINLVLKRDYDGATLGMTYGISSRGDAASKRLDGSLGVTSKTGQSQLMIAFSQLWGDGLKTSDRDVEARIRALWSQHDREGLLSSVPISASVNIASGYGAPLTLDPAYGGGALGARVTFAPASYAGVSSDGGTTLLTNAGLIDLSVSPDSAAKKSNLLVQPKVSSLLVNGRHHFGPSVEVYVDLLALQNDGRATLGGGDQRSFIYAGAPTNPFQQDIVVSYTLPGFTQEARTRVRTIRATAGLIADLPRDWKANADYSVGSARVEMSFVGLTLNDDAAFAIAYGLAGTPGGPRVNPLGDRATLLAALAPFVTDGSSSTSTINRSDDLSLRLAGPVLQLAGGPLTLSLLAEERRERIPGGRARYADPNYNDAFATALPAGRSATRSYYGELRAPLTDRDSGPSGLKGLELQLALRRDRSRSTIAENVYNDDQVNAATKTSQTTTSTYTAGLRVFPVNGLMVRVSAATGALPPSVEQIGSGAYSLTLDPRFLSQSTTPDTRLVLTARPDPKRPGAMLGGEGVFAIVSGGSDHLEAERARSLSAGVVITPPWLERLRLSIDYTRIDKSREIVRFHSGDYVYFLQHEDEFPGRVIRAPLSNQDRAKGYAAGIVTAIDTTDFNIGRTWIQAVDFQADYRVPTDRWGDFQVRGAATWQPRLTRQVDPQSPEVSSIGYANGPLAWRANSGLDWSCGPLTLGFNANFYQGYRVASASDTAAEAARKILAQGSDRVAAQVYFDVYGARTIHLHEAGGRLRSLDLQFGIQNLLDHRPPAIVAPAAGSRGYSPYGDPRLRRIELSLKGRF